MLARWQFWVTTVIALLVALAAGYSMLLYSQNRTTQSELNSRAQFVQSSAQLEGLYREMVKALADLSVRNQDKALSDLLANQGITLSSTPAAAAGPNRGARP